MPLARGFGFCAMSVCRSFFLRTTEVSAALLSQGRPQWQSPANLLSETNLFDTAVQDMDLKSCLEKTPSCLFMREQTVKGCLSYFRSDSLCPQQKQRLKQVVQATPGGDLLQ